MLVGEKVRLTNRITASLKSYFPQVLDWFEDKDTLVFCNFVEQFDDVKAAQAATAEELTQFFQTHQVVRRSTINRRIQQIQDAGPPLTEDEAIEMSEKIVQEGKEQTEKAKTEASKLFTEMLQRANLITRDQYDALAARVTALEGRLHKEFPNEN